MGLPPEKVLLKWMNFHLKKAGYEKQVTNFSSDLKVSNLFTSMTCGVNFISGNGLVIKPCFFDLMDLNMPFQSTALHLQSY